jgi:hypothetical protein
MMGFKEKKMQPNAVRDNYLIEEVPLLLQRMKL